MQAAEGVLPPRPLRAQEGNRQVDHLRFERRPERLHVRGDTELAKTRHVIGVHDLKMRNVMPIIVSAVSLHGGLDSVEALTHGTIADGVKMHLKVERIQLGNTLVQRDGVDE